MAPAAHEEPEFLGAGLEVQDAGAGILRRNERRAADPARLLGRVRGMAQGDGDFSHLRSVSLDRLPAPAFVTLRVIAAPVLK